jgi:hypothetical protein
MKRIDAFKAKPSAADFLLKMNEVVAQGESNIQVDYDHDAPIFMVVGAPRSGTTVLMQWLSQVGLCTPSNLSARFVENPYFAGLIQRLLSDDQLNYRDELTLQAGARFESNYRKWKDAVSPESALRVTSYYTAFLLRSDSA